MRTLAFGLILLGGLGCTNVQPMGLLAHKKGPPPAAKDKDVPEPPTVSAPKPAYPTVLIVPEEVTVESAAAATQKLTNELEYDKKATPPPSKTAEVSRIKAAK